MGRGGGRGSGRVEGARAGWEGLGQNGRGSGRVWTTSSSAAASGGDGGSGGGGWMTGSVICTWCAHKSKLSLSTASATEIISTNAIGHDHQFCDGRWFTSPGGSRVLLCWYSVAQRRDSALLPS